MAEAGSTQSQIDSLAKENTEIDGQIKKIRDQISKRFSAKGHTLADAQGIIESLGTSQKQIAEASTPETNDASVVKAASAPDTAAGAARVIEATSRSEAAAADTEISRREHLMQVEENLRSRKDIRSCYRSGNCSILQIRRGSKRRNGYRFVRI